MAHKPVILVFLTSALLSGCIQSEYQRWSGPIPLDTITFESEYNPATGQFINHNRLEILSIQRIGEEKIIYPPPGKHKTLWLKPGDYRAKIKCDRKPGDPDPLGIIKSGTPLRDDQTYNFSLSIKKPGLGQVLECAVDGSGKVYVSLVETIEVVGD